MDNLFVLHEDLSSGCYRHGGYQAFNISDPKPRNIHKASVRDRLLHHAIYRILLLLQEIIKSFSAKPEVGLPLGNLTSQLFVNIYMNEFDQFVKHKLKVKYYIRYADDFIILSDNKNQLEALIFQVSYFLDENLKLQLHSDKVFIKTLASGVDFLGWVNFSDHRVLRTATKHRMINKLLMSQSHERLQSYLGLLTHGNTHKLVKLIRN